MKKLKQLAIATTVSGLLISCGNNEDVIARVGDKDISKQTFDTYLDFKRIDKNNEKTLKSHLDHYLQREALTEAIAKSQRLDEKKLAVEISEIRKEMVISRYFERYLKEQVSENAIKNYYASNIKKFETRKVRVAHILIRTNKNMSEEDRKIKYTRAHEAYSKLKTGVGFAQVATEFSEDSISVKKGGEIGWLNEGAIDPVFSKKIFSELKKDQLSEPFQTSFGFHIVKLLEEPSVVKKPLERVKGDIRNQLRKKVKEVEMERLLNSIAITNK